MYDLSDSSKTESLSGGSALPGSLACALFEI